MSQERIVDVLAVRNLILSRCPHNAEPYWQAVGQYFRGELSSTELSQRVTETLGPENLSLHNLLLRALLHNAEYKTTQPSPVPIPPTVNTDIASQYYQGVVRDSVIKNTHTEEYERTRCTRRRDLVPVEDLHSRMSMIASGYGVHVVRDDAVQYMNTTLRNYLRDVLELGNRPDPEEAAVLSRARLALVTSVNPMLIRLNKNK